MAKVNKVWQAFTKFIQSQVVQNHKCVDTQLIGLIFMDDRQGVAFMPSVEYLEAGKFKFRQGERETDGMRDE